MPAPAPLPLRVLFKGPSTFVWTSMMGGPRSDLPFPRVMEQQLLAEGRSVQIWNAGANGWPTKDLFRTWDEEVASFYPDVIVLAGAHMETIHVLLPRWLERGANKVNRRPGLVTTYFHRKVLRLLARLVLIVQRRIDKPGVRNKRRDRRALRDTEAYLDMTAKVGSPLILLLEVHPPAPSKVAWFGGWPERVLTLNAELRKLAEARPNVEFFEIRDLMAQFDPGNPEDLWADGIHFCPDFHRAIGVKLAKHVEEWAATQPHLAQP